MSVNIELEKQKALQKLRKVVHGRIVGIMAHGKSIEELEHRIHEFKDYDISWVSLNLGDMIMDPFILNKIGKQLDLIFNCFTLTISEEAKIKYEKEVRMPRLTKFMNRSPNHYVISTWRYVGTYYRSLNLHDYFIKNEEKFILLDYLFGQLTAANSLALLMYAMGVSKPKKIIMFGMDGFTGLSHEALSSYYKSEIHEKEKRRCFAYDTEEKKKNPLPLPISSNTASLEKYFMTLYKDYCNKCEVNNPPEIVNCSPNSAFTIFRKITYNELEGELDS